MTRRGFGTFCLIAGFIMAGMTLKEKGAMGAMDTNGPTGFKGHIRNRHLFNFAAGASLLTEWEREHLRECEVCQEITCLLIRQPFPPKTEVVRS